MESESGAKIAIRGKGSVKEGKGRSDAAHTSNQEEDLHCLIMADTEEKVNKAKKLIHNVIETVRLACLSSPTYLLKMNRLPPFPKGKTSSSVTSYVSLRLSTVRYATTRTRPARTAVKSVIASTIVPRSRTIPPVSFAVPADKLVTWLVIVLNVVLAAVTGATILDQTGTKDALAVLGMSWTVSSTKWVPTEGDRPALSSMATEAAVMATSSAISSPGSVAPPAARRPGPAATVMTAILTPPLRRGLQVAAVPTTRIATTTAPPLLRGLRAVIHRMVTAAMGPDMIRMRLQALLPRA